MTDCSNWADIFAASTKNNALIRCHCGFLFAVLLYDFEGLHVTEVYAFSAGYAFGVIDFWVPRYLIAGNLLIFFFWHFISLIKKEAS
jgi:hypothetical protein